jgi:hypothetical protein
MLPQEPEKALVARTRHTQSLPHRVVQTDMDRPATLKRRQDSIFTAVRNAERVQRIETDNVISAGGGGPRQGGIICLIA